MFNTNAPLGNKVENGLDLDTLTCRAIGIIFMLMLISVPSLKYIYDVKCSLVIGCTSLGNTDIPTDQHLKSNMPRMKVILIKD